MPGFHTHSIGAFDVRGMGGRSGRARWCSSTATSVIPGPPRFSSDSASATGCGRPSSPATARRRGFDQVQDLLDLVLFYRELVKSFGAGPVDLVGHSTGGMIAAELAIIAPDQVRRLVLVDAFGLWLDDEPSQDPFGAAQAVAGRQVVRPGGQTGPGADQLRPRSRATLRRHCVPGPQLRRGHQVHVAHRRTRPAPPAAVPGRAHPRRQRRRRRAWYP